MGVFPDLKNSVIFDNYTSDPLHTAFINEYLDEECNTGRMSGPYTHEEVEGILGPFQCSPILVNVQEQGPGVDPKLRVVQNYLKSNGDHPATNNYIDPALFPTRFGSANKDREFCLLSLSF